MPMTFTRRGAVQVAHYVLLPIVATLLLGMAFGLLSTKAGLSVIEVTLMSGLVFSADSQFAAMQIFADDARRPVRYLTGPMSLFQVRP